MTRQAEKDIRSAPRKRVREPYLPETVKQALASAKRTRRQVYRAWLALDAREPLLSMLLTTRDELTRIERRLRLRALPMARKDGTR